MPYCPNCGAKNKDGARFCESCGAALVAAAPPSAPVSQAQSAAQPAAKSLGNANTLIIVAAAIYAFTVPLGAMYGGMFGFIAALLALAVILILAYEPLRKGNVASAKTGVVIGAALALVYTLIDFAMGSAPAAFVNLIAAVVLGAAYMQLK